MAWYAFAMITVIITLQDENQSFLESAIKSGRYISESDVVAEALVELKLREEIRQRRFDELKAKIKVGIDQADRGDFVEFNADDIKAAGRKRLAELAA